MSMLEATSSIFSVILYNRVYIDYDDLFEGGCRAWNTLTPERLQTVCATSWIKRAN